MPHRLIPHSICMRRAVISLPSAFLLSSVLAASASAQSDRVVTIVLAGDTGFNANHQRVESRGVYKHRRFQTWKQTTAGIIKDINGDINFLNVETVVTDRNDLRRDTKGQGGPFNFRSHPAGLRHLVDTVGFNVLSLANNHSMDYGVAGLKDTLRHIAALRRGGRLKAATGIGLNREQASRPQVVRVKGLDVAFAAIGIVTNNLARHRAGLTKPGQIAYRFDADYAEILRRLSVKKSDYRILSIHYGIEGRVRTDGRQIKEWRRQAALGAGIDLIVGHHAHVVRGVEIVGSKVIFYGLGNFLHQGTANMSGKGICRDYGLLARVHALKGGDGRLRAAAIEAIPITAMHFSPRRLAVKKSHARVHALNYLGARLGSKDGKARGVRFTPQRDGSGLYCFPGAAKMPGRIGALCANWQPAPPIPASLRRRIAGSCRR